MHENSSMHLISCSWSGFPSVREGEIGLCISVEVIKGGCFFLWVVVFCFGVFGVFFCLLVDFLIFFFF